MDGDKFITRNNPLEPICINFSKIIYKLIVDYKPIVNNSTDMLRIFCYGFFETYNYISKHNDPKSLLLITSNIKQSYITNTPMKKFLDYEKSKDSGFDPGSKVTYFYVIDEDQDVEKLVMKREIEFNDYNIDQINLFQYMKKLFLNVYNIVMAMNCRNMQFNNKINLERANFKHSFIAARMMYQDNVNGILAEIDNMECPFSYYKKFEAFVKKYIPDNLKL